jgi:Methyltransferase domain
MSAPASPPDRLEPLRRIARRLPGAMAAGRWLHRRLDPDLREIDRLTRDASGQLFQPGTDTWDERYPELFDALAERLAALPVPAILSFGCSSGAEVRALRRRLPGARIVGMDLNRRMLARARKADPGGDYRCASAPEPGENFDAILALAVFRHGELQAKQPPSCAAILPFARFAQGLAALDGALRPGGWLALCNAHFRLSDSALAPRYAADPLRLPPRFLARPIYGTGNQLVGVEHDTEVLFRKLPDAANA